MRSEFDELKRFAIANVLSVSGKEKTTSTIEKHIDNIIDVAIAREQNQQSKIDELQKRVDVQTKHIETALLAVKDIHKSALDEFVEWDVLAEKAPKLCEHMQDLSVAVGELEQALKGEQP